MPHPQAMCPQKPFDQQTAFAAAVVEIAAAEIAAAAVVAAAVAEMESRGLASLDKFRMDRFPGAGIPHQYISDLKTYQLHHIAEGAFHLY